MTAIIDNEISTHNCKCRTHEPRSGLAEDGLTVYAIRDNAEQLFIILEYSDTSPNDEINQIHYRITELEGNVIETLFDSLVAQEQAESKGDDCLEVSFPYPHLQSKPFKHSVSS